MYARATNAHVFNNFTYSSYDTSGSYYLLRPPAIKETLGAKHCGNGLIEEGKDCDCAIVAPLFMCKIFML